MVDPSSWEIRSTIWPQRLVSARNSLDRASRIIIALGLMALFGSAAWVTYDLSPSGMSLEPLTPDYHTWLHPAYLNSLLISLIIFYALRQISRTREKLAPLAYPLIERIERIHSLEIWRSVEPVTRRSMHLHVIKRNRYPASREEWKTVSQSWVRRAERARRLVSPHTARIIDCGFAQGNRFYSMVEMPRGIRLDEFIAAYGAVPVNRALFLLVQLAHSIEEAHHHGFNGLNIRARNIYIGSRAANEDWVTSVLFGYEKEGLEQDTAEDIRRFAGIAAALLTGKLLDQETFGGLPVREMMESGGVPYAIRQPLLECLERREESVPPIDELVRRLWAAQTGPEWTIEDASRWWKQYRASETRS